MAILSRLNSFLLKSQERKEHLTPEALSTGWCGLPPASETEILRTERRLGITLPPSYRSFLSISNGWCPFDDLVERLLSAEQIDRFRSADPGRLALLLQHYREDDLPDSEYLDYENPKKPRSFEASLLPRVDTCRQAMGIRKRHYSVEPRHRFPRWRMGGDLFRQLDSG